VLPGQAVRWVTDAAGPGSRLVAVRRLRPGGWHVNHAVDVACGDGGVRRLVLRRWARPGWEADDPDYTVDREVRVLGLLVATSVPAPQVVAADAAGSCCDVPAILLTRLPGHPPRRADASAEGFCRQLAHTLALIHAVGERARPAVVPYRLYYDRARAEPARWMSGSRTWARATAAVREAPPAGVPTLIHRDYHPENTLWSRGRLTGVVDWTQASWGPPELDVAHMRWNLAADHGQQVADRFLACYRAVTGQALANQPYWDLVSLLDLLLDGDPDDPGDIGPDDQRMFEAYAEAALSRFQPR
jgi:aminoglycoside phosphotransferase (APT) family kinase protein